MFLFMYVISFFKKGTLFNGVHYSGGDIRKYGTSKKLEKYFYYKINYFNSFHTAYLCG